MTQRSMRVELLGLPAAGKTSVVRAAASLLEATGVAVDQPMARAERGPLVARRLRSAARIAASTLRRPGFVVASLRAVASTRQPSFRSWFKVTHHFLLVCSLARDGRTDVDARLFDQGPYQAVWSVAFGGRRGGETALLDRLVALAPAPDLLVVLRSPPRRVAHRMAARTGGRSRIDRERTPASRETALRHGATVLENVIASIERRRSGASPDGNGPAVLVLGDEELDVNARRLADAVGRLLRH